MFFAWAVVKAKKISKTIEKIMTILIYLAYDITLSMFLSKVSNSYTKEFTLSHISIYAYLPQYWSRTLAQQYFLA